ncbi:MAG: hypothetical protein IKE15_00025 [Clostridia bacterium]|nr:hypothetical protein [Clostridia bacterium]
MKRLAAMILAVILLSGSALAEKELSFKKQKESILLIEGENRLIEDANEVCSDEKMKKLVDGFNAAIDALPEDKPPIYLYLAESSRSHPIAPEFDEDSPGYLYLKENLHADVFDHLKYSTYEQFCDYFYTTDHHWNYKGSYQAYKDIVRMLLGEEEEVLVPAEEFVCKQIFNGSYARRLRMPVSKEKFVIYRFDPLPAYACYTSVTNMKKGKKSAYSHFNNYLKGDIKNGKYANHYAQCYGGDNGFLLFTSEKHKDRVLLLIGNSLSNAVKTLLTEHYGLIVYVDPRSYKNKTHKDFSLSGTIEQFNVNQVLFLGDVNLFIYGDVPKP